MSSQMTKSKFSVQVQTAEYQKLINNTLGDPERAKRFVGAITSAVAVNPALQDCDAGSVLAGALLGEALNLSPSPQLGQYYLVPFNDKKCGKKAQFILGYKGYIQLAIRSGQYRKINVVEIKHGEFKRFNPLTEEFEIELISNFSERENAETVGYYAMFEYLNGFTKSIYWEKDKMLSHADKYSPAFSRASYEKMQKGEIADKDLWKYSSYWYKDFDGMAKKTMLRQLISRWGIMSLDMQTAFEKDHTLSGISNGAITTNPINKDDAQEPDIIQDPVAPEEVNMNEL